LRTCVSLCALAAVEADRPPEKNPLANLDDAHWRARGLARRAGAWSEARPQNVGTLLDEDQGPKKGLEIPARQVLTSDRVETMEQLQGRSLLDTVHPDDREQVHARVLVERFLMNRRSAMLKQKG
jgi:hypothetical protein